MVRHHLPEKDATPCRGGCADTPQPAGGSWLRRLHAWFLHVYADGYNAKVDARKRHLIGELRGAVLEIGPGSGANIGYFAPGIRWTGVEPNPMAHPYLLRKADAAGLDATLLTGTAERLPVPDASQDAVVSTLVLCSVADPDRVLAEVRRVLRPGGRFVFIEHVGAEPGSGERRWQRRVKPVWRRLGDGCEPDRDTAGRIRAAGFARVDIEPFRMPYPIVAPHIAGRAER